MNAVSTKPFQRYVALGDSQTEGVGDELHPDGTPRGWADRFAEQLSGVSPELLYANLAVRGRRIVQVHEEQLEPALVLKPDLASVIAGVNDMIRPRFDLDAALSHMDAMTGVLRSQGATVLTATFPDPSSVAPLARLMRERLAAFNAGLRALAAAHGALLVDLERVPLAADPRLWCDDRLHLNAEGHRELAAAMAEAVLGMPAPDERPNVASIPPSAHDAHARLLAELRWGYRFLLPWIWRRLTGRSSGDGRRAKRPELLPVSPTEARSHLV
jgi:lysophospholipase L1-like esterase